MTSRGVQYRIVPDPWVTDQSGLARIVLNYAGFAASMKVVSEAMATLVRKLGETDLDILPVDLGAENISWDGIQYVLHMPPEVPGT